MDSGTGNIMVVLGSHRDEIMKVTGCLPVQYCRNENYREGMLSSVRCGFRSLPVTAEAALVFLGDQPVISPSSIRSVILAYGNSGNGIVIPVCEGKRGHPVLLSMKYREEIEKLDPEKGLRSLTDKHPGDVHEVEVNDHGILRDIDTKDNYLQELNQI